jgi:hypothetical protein
MKKIKIEIAKDSKGSTQITAKSVCENHSLAAPAVCVGFLDGEHAIVVSLHSSGYCVGERSGVDVLRAFLKVAFDLGAVFVELDDMSNVTDASNIYWRLGFRDAHGTTDPGDAAKLGPERFANISEVLANTSIKCAKFLGNITKTHNGECRFRFHSDPVHWSDSYTCSFDGYSYCNNCDDFDHRRDS